MSNPAVASEQGIVSKLIGSRNLTIGATVTVILLAMAIVSYVWTPYSPTGMNFRDKLQGLVLPIGSAPTISAATSCR